jgi:hypothetical protein
MRHTLPIVASLLVLAGCSNDLVSPENQAPEVTSITVGLNEVYRFDACPVVCAATDPDGDRVTYEWVVGSGTVEGSGRDVVYTPTSCCVGGNPVFVIVRDGRGGETRAELFIPVKQ